MSAPAITHTPDPALSYFPTPAEVADELVYLSLCPGYGQGEAGGDVPRLRVLEPSAGEGHLARAVRKHLPYAHITAVEPSPQRVPALHDVADEVVASTLEDYLSTAPASFDLVVMNPPYTLADRPEAWAEHVLAIHRTPGVLTPGAMIAAIVPHIVVTGKSRLVRAVRDLLGAPRYRYSDGEVVYENGRVQRCERGAFEAVGAGIRPVLMWIETPAGGTR